MQSVHDAIGNIGGFSGPFAFGWIKSLAGSDTIALMALSCAFLAAGFITLYLGKGRARPARARTAVGKVCDSQAM